MLKNFKFTNESQNIPEEFLVDTGGKCVINNSILGPKGFDYYCKKTNTQAKVINYYSHYPEQVEGEIIIGGGYSRSAIICGNLYYIRNRHITGQTLIYGPFYLER